MAGPGLAGLMGCHQEIDSQANPEAALGFQVKLPQHTHTLRLLLLPRRCRC